MNIGELARRSGVSASRIRFYESIGLLTEADRQPNGYRVYRKEAAFVLELIGIAQKAGFSLDEIRALVPSDLENWHHDNLLETLRRKVVDIEELQKRLRQSRQQLVALIEEIEAKPADIDCADNARLVLSRMLERKADLPDMEAGDVKLLGKSRSRRSFPKSR